MSTPAEAERVARAALTWVAEPGDPAMGALLAICSPAEIVAALTEGRMPLPAATAPSGSGMLWADRAGAGPAVAGSTGTGPPGTGAAGTKPAGTESARTG